MIDAVSSKYATVSLSEPGGVIHGARKCASADHGATIHLLLDWLESKPACETLVCYQAKKRIGAFAAILDGGETLIPAGGIGDNARLMHHRICAGLGLLGIELGNGEVARRDIPNAATPPASR